MDRVSRCKKDVKKIKDKLRSAKRRLIIAERSGADKKIDLAQKHISGWEEKLLDSKENLSLAKESNTDSTVGKRILNYSGLAIALVCIAGAVTVIAGNYRSGESDGEGDVAADSV